jgi:hypothetical protein
MPVKLFRGKHLPIVVNSYLFFSQLVPTQTKPVPDIQK